MDIEKILSRIQEQKKFDRLTDFAEFLGMNLSNFSRWKQKNDANLTYIVNACRGMDLNYIFYGKSIESKSNKELQQVRAELEQLRSDYDALTKAYIKLSIENEKNIAVADRFLRPQISKMDDYLHRLRQLHSEEQSILSVADEE